jgi:hypothetical protein
MIIIWLELFLVDFNQVNCLPYHLVKNPILADLKVCLTYHDIRPLLITKHTVWLLLFSDHGDWCHQRNERDNNAIFIKKQFCDPDSENYFMCFFESFIKD